MPYSHRHRRDLDEVLIILSTTGWRPVVAVFCNILFSCNRHIVLSDSIFWFNKLGVNVGILLLYFFKYTIVCACDRYLK